MEVFYQACALAVMKAIAFHYGNEYKEAMYDTSVKGPVAVAVSGGMDSLYSLLFLKESGVELFAMHALFLPPYLRDRAFDLAVERLQECIDVLGVKLAVVDLSVSFEEQVIKPFVQAYLAGKTPNPCALCNPAMKFGLLWDEAAKLGGKSLATGHYVKLVNLADGPAVFAGDDESKDQSYFLARTPLESLARAVFPLARRKKKDIALELANRGIKVPQESESQEICFIKGDDYRSFLRAYAKLHDFKLPGSGPICLVDGQKLGQHSGLWNYTQGQRHGLGIAWKEPLYVLGKDVERNTLIVGPKSSFGRESCLCARPNCLVPPALWPEQVLAKTRYRQRLAPARAELSQDGNLHLHFVGESQQAPAAPGQVAALYAETEQGLRLLAGAEIIS